MRVNMKKTIKNNSRIMWKMACFNNQNLDLMINFKSIVNPQSSLNK